LATATAGQATSEIAVGVVTFTLPTAHHHAPTGLAHRDTARHRQPGRRLRRREAPAPAARSGDPARPRRRGRGRRGSTCWSPALSLLSGMERARGVPCGTGPSWYKRSARFCWRPSGAVERRPV